MGREQDEEILAHFSEKYNLEKLYINLDFISLKYSLTSDNGDEIGILQLEGFIYADEYGEPNVDYSVENLRIALEKFEQSDEFKAYLSEKEILKKFAKRNGLKSVILSTTLFPYSLIDTSDDDKIRICYLMFNNIPIVTNFIPEPVRKYTPEELESELRKLEKTKAFKSRIILNDFAKKHGLVRVSIRGWKFKVIYIEESEKYIQPQTKYIKAGTHIKKDVIGKKLKSILEKFENTKRFKEFKAQFVKVTHCGKLCEVIIKI